MKYFKKIIGERIYLSPRTVEDAEVYTEWLNDFSVTDYTGRSGETMTQEAEKDYLEKGIEKQATFAIIDLKEDKLIGGIDLNKIHAVNRTAELGIFIGVKEYRGKGYGTEAINLILDYGFNYLNLNNINLHLIEFNERALNCYKKCGFKECGRRRKSEFINGKYYDVIEMDMLTEEFTGSYIKNKEIL